MAQTFAELYADVGLEVYDNTAPTGADLTNAKRLVNLGYRQLVAEADWKCLHPEATLALTTGSDGNFDLPAGFAYMEADPIFYAADSGLVNILHATRTAILTARAGSTSGTYASMWAIQPKTFTKTTGQRWELMLWPTPGTALTVTLQYALNPADMSDDAEYPVGGNTFNLAVRAYALRAAERDKRIANGPRAVEAQEALQAAILEDVRERADGPIPITCGRRPSPPYDRRLTQLGPTVDGV